MCSSDLAVGCGSSSPKTAWAPTATGPPGVVRIALAHLLWPLDPSEETRPGHALEQAEQEQRIRKALDRVSPEHRTVLILKDMEGQKYETMAEVLQVPIGTIRSRLHRARLELRELLEKDEENAARP